MEYKLIAERKPNITLLEQILLNRGFSNREEIVHYLNVNENDVLSPLLLDNIKNGASMLIKHISNNDKTFMIVDCDLDGYVSAALFLNYLNNLFPYWVQNCVFYINH